MTNEERADEKCQLGPKDCGGEARYIVRFEWGSEFRGCVDCVAVLRANDPLEYLESVRSIRLAAGVTGSPE